MQQLTTHDETAAHTHTDTRCCARSSGKQKENGHHISGRVASTTRNNNNNKMPDAATLIIATNTALAASKTIVESVANWHAYITPEFMTRRAFETAINNSTVVNFHTHLRLARYSPTPILDAMCNCKGKGKVFVAMAPSGLGKTTAAKQFLHQFKDHRQGIAICVQSAATTTPYVQLMLAALGMSPTNPPQGWLKCLINCLHNAGKAVPGRPYRKPYLVLDDVGGSDVDAQLVMALKSQVRNTNATVIVLTRTKESADFLVSQNGLQGIVPLADTHPNFPNGEWVNLRWEVATYKMSARHQPTLARFSRDQINDAIDEYVKGLTQKEFDQLTPLIMWDVIEERLSPDTLWTAAPNATSSGEGNETDQVGCTECIVL